MKEKTCYINNKINKGGQDRICFCLMTHELLIHTLNITGRSEVADERH